MVGATDFTDIIHVSVCVMETYTEQVPYWAKKLFRRASQMFKSVHSDVMIHV